ncbi:hypothetical protein [Anaerotignum lactatifermentans]|uniref:hypothetical protein n=1 Tax=Anaerotignum lactatifermentans TaxID=160404 RepID=UPI002670F82A|nr:hypothetical protein [Anaerotignum lactatifermentans]
MARAIPIPDFFVSTISEEQEVTLFRKITLRQGAISFIRHTFSSIMMGRVIKIDNIDAKSVKSRLPAVFDGDFQSFKNLNFIDDIAFLELKNDFEAVR